MRGDSGSRPAVSRRAALQGGLGLLAIAGLPALAGCAASAHSHPLVSGAGDLNPLTVALARANVSLGQVDVAPVVAGMTSLGAGLYRKAATMTANWTIS